MALAIFDLDNTLLGGDSDHLWGEYLVRHGIVDAERHRAENDRYYQDYLDGTLDIRAFLRFQLRVLREHDPAQLERWRADFIETSIRPIVLPAGRALLQAHRARGDTLVIITATNRFITEPIARLLDVEHLIATEPEQVDGRYTGEVAGTPCYREGKIECLEAWMRAHGATLAGSWFYSDSHNDIPLLERVDHPVAVDPDPQLAEVARARGWKTMSLRERRDAQDAG